MNKLNLSKILFLALTLSLGILSCQTKEKQQIAINNNPIQFVDPTIGSGGHGHVFVGASVPFGAVQIGPNNITMEWDWCSGYHHSDTTIIGFAHTHLSGTGIGDLGDILIMPVTSLNEPTSENLEAKNRLSTFSHKSETVQPSYYSVHLDKYNIDVELTASERVGFQKYQYNKKGNSQIVIDLARGIGWDKLDKAELSKLDDYSVAGYRFSKGWSKDQRIYFVTRFSKKIKDLKQVGKNAEYTVLNFEGNGELMLKTAISPVSIDGAQNNMKVEIPDWDFEKVQANADKKWNKELNKIQIKTNNKKDLKTFYTACYHSMIAPSLFNDINKDYRGTDKKLYKNVNFNNYSVFSLWDTYRTAHPLFTITQSERVSDMVNSMLKIYEQQGKLPVWHLMGSETNTMVGYSAIPVVVDACLKGIKGIDYKLAYEAVKTTAMGDLHPGVKEMMELGYIPADAMHESVAMAMEYAISDWTISKFAERLNKKEDALYFKKRSEAYKNYFDPSDKFMKGKMTDGSWRTPFNPYSAQHRVNDYCEGNAWQYLWLVPQNPEGLIELMGGDKPFISKLDSLFSISSELEEGASNDITGLIGQYAHGNEPSHHTSYLYAYAGQQYKTADKVRYIMNELYSDQIDGLCGNEDCGQMSAWYIMSSMGMYPVNPSNGAYVFGSPLFDEATINLPENKSFNIIAKNNSKTNIYIQSVSLNGEAYSKTFITHKDILKGGNLVFEMGAKPNKEFGAAAQDRPKSIVY
ncbi:GH92 family glycosyl hydrolase [Ancylomarina sp. YFZ004]